MRQNGKLYKKQPYGCFLYSFVIKENGPGIASLRCLDLEDSDPYLPFLWSAVNLQSLHRVDTRESTYPVSLFMTAMASCA